MSESQDRRLRRTRGTSRNAVDAKIKLERGTPSGQYGQVVFPDKKAVRAAVLEGMCPCCGRGPFTLLARHTHAQHGIDTRELRDLAGLTYSESITPADLRGRRRQIALEQIAQGRFKAKSTTKGRTPVISLAGQERLLRGSQSLRVPRGNCKVCGSPISDSAPARRTTCGRDECVREVSAAARRATRWPRQPCEVCGSPLPEHSGARDRTCSRHCAGILTRRTSRGRKLDTAQVEEIRRLRSEGVPRPQVAERFGISPSTVTDITGGRIWASGE